MQTKLIFTEKVLHLTSLGTWEILELGNGLRGQGDSPQLPPAYCHVWFTYYRMLIHRGSWCTWWNRFGVLHPSTLNPTWDLNPDHVRNKVTADVCIVGFHLKDDPLIHSTINQEKRDSPRSWGWNHKIGPNPNVLSVATRGRTYMREITIPYYHKEDFKKTLGAHLSKNEEFGIQQ